MDAQADPSLTLGADMPRPLFEHSELRAILLHLSHELSRPLVSLRSGFELLLNDPARSIAPDQRGHVQTMVGLCDDLLRLTRSYLDYAGLVQGTRPLQLGPFTIGALVRELDREFRAAAEARGIAWECALVGKDATVVTDAARCQQVFGNLVANALKYTPQGGTIRVVARSEGEHWLLVVADTGAGIPSEALSKVFEPFYRLARDQQAGTEGTGLGLAICRELVDQMGGRITLTSTVGQGTRALVQLPTRPGSPGNGKPIHR